MHFTFKMNQGRRTVVGNEKRADHNGVERGHEAENDGHSDDLAALLPHPPQVRHGPDLLLRHYFFCDSKNTSMADAKRQKADSALPPNELAQFIECGLGFTYEWADSGVVGILDLVDFILIN